MGIVRKPSPIGRDKSIDRLQAYLFSRLAFSNWNSYPRAYKNPRDNSVTPEIYEDGGEYKEIYLDDKVNLTSFFLADDQIITGNTLPYNTNLSIIFQVNLTKVYPSVTDRRPDELFNNDVSSCLKINPNGFEYKGFVTGVDRVYSGLNIEKPKYDNMGDLYVVRFDLFLPSFGLACPSRLADAGDGIVCAGVTVDDQGDETIVPSGGNYICTPFVKSGIVYMRPQISGTQVSYAAYDEVWLRSNGFLDPPVMPTNPEYIAQLDFNSTDPFLTMLNNNFFGNVNRFTNDLGGSVFDGSDTSTADYIIDHLTGLGWYRVLSTQNWAGALNYTNGLTIGVYSNWFSPPQDYLDSLQYYDDAKLTDTNGCFYYPPFNISATILWSSTSATVNPVANAIYFQNDVKARIGKTTFNANTKAFACRNHFT